MQSQSYDIRVVPKEEVAMRGGRAGGSSVIVNGAFTDQILCSFHCPHLFIFRPELECNGFRGG